MLYLLLGMMVKEKYKKVAESYERMPAGKTKEDLLTKANQLMDKVIDLYAHTLALSEGKPTYRVMHDQTLQDITPYYKYRHKNSSEGMQQLIDSYKWK